eukprot:TRINITY_DN9418_c0_g1_i1.p1 TRINITY_DN9418_c0_g1~~TRINITY_DN9418_c0_g1_i1.p1  ORF type:complete len:259 (-),score=34.76 TRINITY_DN9418_c0_g1_i1:46-822(-)
MAPKGICSRKSLTTLVLCFGAAAGALAFQHVALLALLIGLVLKLVPVSCRSGASSQWSGSARAVCVKSSPSPLLTPMASSQANFSWEEIRPPLPDAVVSLLHSTRLGYLSTAMVETNHQGNSTPHLSLMNFTYVQGDEVIIMTTRKDTQKYLNLLAHPHVALLVHDFPTLREGETSENHNRTYSITLYGTVRVPANEEQDKRYRQIHLENNPSSQCFIIGENIAVIVICVESARLCNNQDKVTTWSAPASQGACSTAV